MTDLFQNKPADFDDDDSRPELPTADFDFLVYSLRLQAELNLGLIPMEERQGQQRSVTRTFDEVIEPFEHRIAERIFHENVQSGFHHPQRNPCHTIVINTVGDLADVLVRQVARC